MTEGQLLGAIETVISGNANPGATLDYPDGDRGSPQAAGCARVAPGLWMLTTDDGSSAGFVRRADGAMVALPGSIDDAAALRRAIMAAHRAGDAELWPRIGAAPVNFFFL